MCRCKSLVDLTLVLDSSTAVRDWTAIQQFAVSIIDWFDVGLSQARVAVVVVGRTSSVVVRLDQFSYNRQQLYTAIRNISHVGGPRFSLLTYLSTSNSVFNRVCHLSAVHHGRGGWVGVVVTR